MIEVSDLSKVYGKGANAFEALKQVSFMVPDGKTVAIIGKSGSGKSTLMHIMGGLDRPSTGDLAVDGKSLAALTRKEMDRFRAEDLGFVFQSFFIEGNQTCYENIALPLEIIEMPYAKRKQRIEWALKNVELLDKVKSKAKNLSGGQKQRLAIARAIVKKPKYIFADEPTGNLDSTTGDKIMDLLFRLTGQLGSTLCIITHDTDLAARCEIRLSMKDGELTLGGKK